MRKVNRVALFVAAILCCCAGVSNAWIFDQAPDKTMTLRYRLPVAANTSTSSVVIDLSNTTTWPHKDTGEIDLSSVRIEFDKVAASTVTAKLGVVNFVNTSTGSVTWFYVKENNLNVSNTGIEDPLNLQPCFIRARALKSATADTDGTTPYILSNDTTSGSTTYQTDVTLTSLVSGGVAPGVGDIVLFVQTGGATTVNVELQYHSEK